MLEKRITGQKMLNRPLLSDYLKQEDLELPSQIKEKRKQAHKKQSLKLMEDVLLQKKEFLRDLKLQ